MYNNKWSELNRSLDRIERFYDGFQEYSGAYDFSGPKDFVKNFFRVNYEFKESLKSSIGVSVEKFINSSNLISLSIDIANQEKHIKLNKKRRSSEIVGAINSHIYIFDRNKDRTELTIEISGKKIDCLKMGRNIIKEWLIFLKKNKLI